MRCYIIYQHQGLRLRQAQLDTAKVVLQKIVPFYEKGNIPMITNKKACEKIVALFQKNVKLRELPTDRRSSASSQSKLEDAPS